MKIAGSYSQLVYYSKGWFETTDTISDLKKIVAHRSGISEEYVNTSHIINLLNDAVCSLMDVKDVGKFLLDFLSAIDPDSMMFKMFDKKYDFREAVISKYLGLLGLLKIYEGDECLIKLDDIDPTIMKLKKINDG